MANPEGFDLARASERIARDIGHLSGPEYTSSRESICRYAYTPEYARTLDFFVTELGSAGLEVESDPIGTLVARNRPKGSPVFGLGSHCDSNRNGGAYDGTLGVVIALEICRQNMELGLNLPLQVMAFLEEEGSGFGQVLLGSRIMSGRMTGEEINSVRSLDDDRGLLELASEAGYESERWPESIRAFDDLIGWIEPHIEQGRALQDRGQRIGVVSTIVGYVHADITFTGRADHAGATPMDLRSDAALMAAETIVELERLTDDAGLGTVATVGEIDLSPGSLNVIPGAARLSLDIRGVEDEAVRSVADRTADFAAAVAARRDGLAAYVERQQMPATVMDHAIVQALESAAESSGEPWAAMSSGAAHDTMCVADHSPTAMVFVPCRDGISHSPLEHAEADDAALAAKLITEAIRSLI